MVRIEVPEMSHLFEPGPAAVEEGGNDEERDEGDQWCGDAPHPPVVLADDVFCILSKLKKSKWGGDAPVF